MTNFNDTVPDYLRVIRLGFGAGQPGGSACWMTALQAHMSGQWTDQCDCVDLTINALCIAINDIYQFENDRRTEDIMNFGLFRVLGTKGTEEDSYKRMMHLANVVIREWFLTWLHEMGVEHKITLPEFHCPADVGQFCPDRDVVFHLKDHIEPLFIGILKEVTISITHFTRAQTPGFLVNFLPVLAASLHPLPPGLYGNDGGYAYPSLVSYNRKVELSQEQVSKRRDRFLKDKAYPLLADLIEMGPHGPIEQDLPVCGVKTFHEKVGVKHADHLQV